MRFSLNWIHHLNATLPNRKTAFVDYIMHFYINKYTHGNGFRSKLFQQHELLLRMCQQIDALRFMLLGRITFHAPFQAFVSKRSYWDVKRKVLEDLTKNTGIQDIVHLIMSFVHEDASKMKLVVFKDTKELPMEHQFNLLKQRYNERFLHLKCNDDDKYTVHWLNMELYLPIHSKNVTNTNIIIKKMVHICIFLYMLFVTYALMLS